MIVHGGGIFEDKEGTLKRIEKNLQTIPDKIKRRLTFENDEFNYGMMDLLPICANFKIPCCFDTFHHSIFNDCEVTAKLIERIV